MSEPNPDLLLSSYDFELPEALIAQRPVAERDASRLLRLERLTGVASHHAFRDLSSMLHPGDVLVMNDTRVIPARLRGQRPSGGKIEVLLLHLGARTEAVHAGYAERWEALVKPAARLRIEEPVDLGGGLKAWPERRSGEAWVLRLEADRPVLSVIEEVGEVPLPPYIRRDAEERRGAEDLERYQTVFARQPGSAAAPTAGLHFSPGLLESLRGRGIEIHHLTLHVGPGTFSPVRSEDIREHRMHRERYVIPETVWQAVQRAKAEGRRVIAVGTTSVRALESAAEQIAGLDAGAGRGAELEAYAGTVRQLEVLDGSTSIFIHPGFRFRVIDGLITNFHLPRSSLIMLVSALAGREHILAAYRTAVEHGYRFFSYGDAMLIE